MSLCHGGACRPMYSLEVTCHDVTVEHVVKRVDLYIV